MTFVGAAGVHNHPVHLEPKREMSLEHKKPKMQPQLQQHDSPPVQYMHDTRPDPTPGIAPAVSVPRLWSQPRANQSVPVPQPMLTHLNSRNDPRATFSSKGKEAALEHESSPPADDVLAIAMAMRERAHATLSMGPLGGLVHAPQIPGAGWPQPRLVNHSAPQPIAMHHVLDVARFQEQFGVDVSPTSYIETFPHVPQAGHNHNTYQAAYAPEQATFRFSDLDDRSLDAGSLVDQRYRDEKCIAVATSTWQFADEKEVDRSLGDRSLDTRSLDAVATMCHDLEFARYDASRSGSNRVPVSQYQFNASANGTHSMHTGQHPSIFLQHSFAPAQHTQDLTTMQNPHAQHAIDAPAPCFKKADFKSSPVTQVSICGS